MCLTRFEQQQYGVKSSVIEEKATAMETVTRFAQHLQLSFLPYVAAVVDAFLPSVDDRFDENIRNWALSGLPAFMSIVLQATACNKVPFEAVEKLFDSIFQTLSRVIEEEVDWTVQLSALSAMALV